jgi:hypothetical protein
MAAVTTRLLSVSDAVLPPDVTLAVVDREGEVLFHSDPAQSLTHNLLAETADDGALAAAVSGAADALSSGRYWGRRHRFAVAPLREVPWSLVALRDEVPAREAVAGMVRGGLALALGYAAAAVALAWLALAIADARGARGPWPRPERRGAYAEAIVSTALLATCWLGALRTAPAERAIQLAFAGPVAAVVLWALAFRVGPLARAAAVLPAAWRRRADARTARWTGGLHAAALALAGVCIAALPGVSLARAVAGRTLHDVADRERRALQAREAARNESAAQFHGHLLRRDRGTTQEGASTADGRLLRARLAETLDLYPTRVFADEDGAGGGGPFWFGATRHAPPAAAPAGGTLAGLALLGTGVALLVRWTTRRVLPDSVRAEPRSYDDLRQGRVASAVCLLPSGSDVDRALQGGWCRRIDVRDGVAEELFDASRPAAIDLRGFAEAGRRCARLDTPPGGGALRRPAPARVPRHLPPRGRPPAPGGRGADVRRRGDGRLAAPVRAAGDGGGARRRRGLGLARRAVGPSPAGPRRRPRARAVPVGGAGGGAAPARPRRPAAAAGAFAAHDREAMVDRLAEIAEDYYADLWGACASDERRVLADVCAGRFVARALHDAAGRVLDRGLAVGDPVVRPMNRSFGAFVLRQEVPAPDPVEPRPGWREVLLPLLVLAAACGGLAWLLHAAPLRLALGVMAALPG